MRTLEFDMTGYLPGAHSLSGWIVGATSHQFPCRYFQGGIAGKRSQSPQDPKG